jgi:hypothetical protein
MPTMPFPPLELYWRESLGAMPPVPGGTAIETLCVKLPSGPTCWAARDGTELATRREKERITAESRREWRDGVTLADLPLRVDFVVADVSGGHMTDSMSYYSLRKDASSIPMHCTKLSNSRFPVFLSNSSFHPELYFLHGAHEIE